LTEVSLSFEEAMTTFDDYFALYMEDPTHSKSELRFIIIGYTINNRLAVVSYIERNNKIRIISARLATKKERIAYEEKR